MANSLDDYKPRDMGQGYPWIKLRTNLVDDPRYMRLSDLAKVAYFEAYILAGKSDAGGLVLAGDDPANIQDLAWLLRKTDADIQNALAELARAGLVDMQDGQVTICRFTNEQGPSHAEKRKEWAKRQRNKRALANGETLPDESESENPEPDESKETEAEAGKDSNQNSDKDSELKTQTKRVQKTHAGVTRDKDFDGYFDDFAKSVLYIWESQTGKTYGQNEAFNSMIQEWIDAGVLLKHVNSAIEQNKGKAETPLYLQNIAVKIKNNDPQIVAKKRIDKFKEMAKSLQDGA